MDGFFGNCPGLILDVEILLNEWGANDFAETYRAAASELLNVIEVHASLNPVAQGSELDDFWAAFEATDESVGVVETKSIEASAFSKERENDAKNWFTELETKILKFVEDNPSHFKQSET
ncbi:hypothetical protein A8B78_05565 [Jannaschia sp. EhC01]|nr:hypothetical protein A8B78_05565 [Jannaschia sp. EhC01]